MVYIMHNRGMQKRLLSCLVLSGLVLVSACGSSSSSSEAKVKNAALRTTTTASTATTSTTSTSTTIASTTTSAAVTTSTTATTSTAAASVICGQDNGEFPDLSQFPGAGTEFDAPSVTVTCSSDTLTVKSNGITSYPFVKKTPAGLKSQSFTWTISTKPAIAAKQTSIETKMSAVAFTVTGLPIYGPMEGPTPAVEAYGDPVYNNLLDTCGGHTGYNADYHYHQIFAVSACSLEETIVGYALDGFPIYSNPQYKLKSGYEKTGNPKSYSFNAHTYTSGTDTLDECNGQTQSDGSYRYYVTETFPYVIGCYTGTAKKQSGVAAQSMPAMNTVSASSAFKESSLFVTPTSLFCDIKKDELKGL